MSSVFLWKCYRCYGNKDSCSKGVGRKSQLKPGEWISWKRCHRWRIIFLKGVRGSQSRITQVNHLVTVISDTNENSKLWAYNSLNGTVLVSDNSHIACSNSLHWYRSGTFRGKLHRDWAWGQWWNGSFCATNMPGNLFHPVRILATPPRNKTQEFLRDERGLKL